MPRHGKRRTKKRTHKTALADDDEQKVVPKCFVVKRGKPCQSMQNLVKDFRNVMLPNCAKNLKESKKNRTKDYANIAGALNVSHFIAFHNTKAASYMKLARFPSGPTLSFKVHEYSLGRDVKNIQRRPRNNANDFLVAPLLVLNGFGGNVPPQIKLMAEILRNMFESIDVRTLRVTQCRRVVVFNYDKATNRTEFRHFAINQRPAGISRGVRKLLRPKKKNLDLSRSNDISDYVQDGGYGSESEAEDAVDVGVQGRGNMDIAINLQELGPRLNLQFLTAEDGLLEGKTLFEEKAEITEQEKKVKEERAEAEESLAKKLKAEKAQRKAARRALRANIEAKKEAAIASDGDASGSEGDADTAEKGGQKKERYHPFSWKKNKKKAADKAAEQAENTVEFDEEPAPKEQNLKKLKQQKMMKKHRGTKDVRKMRKKKA